MNDFSVISDTQMSQALGLVRSKQEKKKFNSRMRKHNKIFDTRHSFTPNQKKKKKTQNNCFSIHFKSIIC